MIHTFLTVMSALASVFALLVGLLVQAPASVTGTWEGTFSFFRDGQLVDTDPVSMVLKQDGATLTGTAGPNAGRQFPITKVKFKAAKEGTTMAFEVEAGSLVLWFDLKLENGIIKGLASGEKNGEKQTAQVELKPVK